MNTITLENEYGEKMEVGRTDEGDIVVCHDDATAPDEFAEFIDLAEFGSIGELSVGEFIETVGIGGFLLTDAGSMILNPDETRQIKEAARKLDGRTAK